MEQRRLLLFFVSSMAILVVWTNFLAPILMPLPQKPPAEQEEAQQPKDEIATEESTDDSAEEPVVAKAGDTDPKTTEAVEENVPAKPDSENAPSKQPIVKETPEAEKPEKLVADWPDKVEHRNITLGSDKPETGYFMQVELTSQGAGILSLKLSDPRYRKLDDTDQSLSLIESNNEFPPTLGTVFYDEEQELISIKDAEGLNEWQVAKDENGKDLIEEDAEHPGVNTSVTFRSVYSGLGIEVFKTFKLTPSDKSGEELEEARMRDAAGYELLMEVKARNLTEEQQSFVYHLQGPVGVPLENRENTRKFRQVAIGFLQDDGSVESEVLTAADLVDSVDENEPEVWNAPMRYIGVDIQYFAALIVPVEDQNTNQTYTSAMPMLLQREKDDNHSDLSVVLQSKLFELEPKGELHQDGSAADVVQHQVSLFAGPKREVLLTGMQADSILDYGRMGVFASVMLKVLNWLHLMGLPYGIAIVVLTIMVRSCLYPLSRKQALGAKKMKELQPKLKELKKKYAKDKEKQARAQMELFRKHNYNPLAGCLPLLLQFPIFISLYTAISSSVDLRLAPFLWIDNLAAPDALFQMPMALPFLGQSFNLLPILTIFLFIAQQRLFMPPPESDEQAMQYKMMNMMMVVMGFLFYRVPAGLCLYFITSSLWGMSERKLLDFGKPKTEPAAQPSKA
ncbi:MAG: membrane protein insertase YidC [Planctomycetaceae bacterium]|jgi:YidC/Oxa1 family membrane protein insertase|nr:membrane protein insertase YidC [Planctomycetaceae bacterium]